MIRELLSQIMMFFLLTSLLFNCSLDSANGSFGREGLITVAHGDSVPFEGYAVDQVLVDNTAVTVINNVYSFKDATFKKEGPISSFSVVGTAGIGGVASPSNSTVEKGKDITFVITPDTGYIVDKATLNGNVVTVTGDLYTAKNVQSNIEFDVTFKAVIPSGWNGTIPPGGTVSFGMNGSYSGENNPPTVSVK